MEDKEIIDRIDAVNSRVDVEEGRIDTLYSELDVKQHDSEWTSNINWHWIVTAISLTGLILTNLYYAHLIP